MKGEAEKVLIFAFGLVCISTHLCSVYKLFKRQILYGHLLGMTGIVLDVILYKLTALHNELVRRNPNLRSCL